MDSDRITMLFGTLITMFGFVPIGFAKSGVGEYAGNIFWVLAFSLLISWLVAVTFTPYLGVQLLAKPRHDAERRIIMGCMIPLLQQVSHGGGCLRAPSRRRGARYGHPLRLGCGGHGWRGGGSSFSPARTARKFSSIYPYLLVLPSPLPMRR
ncbi:MAG: hypothetical protein R3F38_08065 [Gammaproteobacteria bacterium]